MMNTLLVFLGGGAGAALRHGVNGLALRYVPGIPAGTLAVNVLGSLAMGVLIAVFASKGGSIEARALLATGFLGGFTTFSAFSLDVVLLWQRGEPWVAAGYALASVALAIGGLVAGMAATSRFLGAGA